MSSNNDCNGLAGNVLITAFNVSNEHCGVADHAKRLSALIGIPYNQDKLLCRCKILNLHYPVRGWKNSLLSCMAALLAFFFHTKIILTLHEFERSSWLRRLSSKMLIMLSKKVFVVDNHELKGGKFIDFFSFSNFNEPSFEARGTSQCNEVGFIGFGANKGVSIFLDIASALSSRFTFKAIGQPLLAPQIKDMGFLSADMFVNEVQALGVAFLPYPDGVGERRGTFFLCLSLGVPVVTIAGGYTPSCLLELSGVYFLTLDECRDFKKVSSVFSQAVHGERPILPDQYRPEKVSELYEEVLSSL